MLRPCLAGLVALGALATPVAGAPHGGKVVRVERRNPRGIGEPRLCQFSGNQLTVGQCYGRPVSAGEIVTILSTTGVIAQLHITQVTPDNSCGPTTDWVIEGELDMPVTAAQANTAIAGIVDGGLDPRHAKAVMLGGSPSGRASDVEYYGFDANGDGTPDLMYDHYMCDAQGLPSQASQMQCYELWAAGPRGHEAHLLRTDIVPQC